MYYQGGRAMKWLLSITAVIGLALVGLALTARRGESVMDKQLTQTTTVGAIPAIDAAAPAKFETATFAAG
jgi:hypothetical protein